MGKNGMRRQVYCNPDPTFDAVVGVCRKEARRSGKEERTMAEKMEETGVVGAESLRILAHVKMDAEDIPGKLSRALRLARQAQSIGDVDSLTNILMELETRLYGAGRAVSRVRCRMAAVKVDLLPHPEGEDAHE